MSLWDSIYKNIKKQIKPQVIKPYPVVTDCTELDKQIKLLDIAIADAHRKELTEGNKAKEFGFKATAELLSEVRGQRQASFVNGSCALAIENIKAQETAKIIGSEVGKYEDDVLSGSGKESKQLFMIGGVVLLVALGIILMATKKKK